MTYWSRTPSADFPHSIMEDKFLCKVCGGGRRYLSYTLGHIFMHGPDDLEKVARSKKTTWACHNCYSQDPYFMRLRDDNPRVWSTCRSKRDPDFFGCFTCRRKRHWREFTWHFHFQFASSDELLDRMDEIGARWCCNHCFDRKVFEL